MGNCTLLQAITSVQWAAMPAARVHSLATGANTKGQVQKWPHAMEARPVMPTSSDLMRLLRETIYHGMVIITLIREMSYAPQKEGASPLGPCERSSAQCIQHHKALDKTI